MGLQEGCSGGMQSFFNVVAATGIPKAHENKVAPLRRLIARMGPEAAPDQSSAQRR